MLQMLFVLHFFLEVVLLLVSAPRRRCPGSVTQSSAGLSDVCCLFILLCVLLQTLPVGLCLMSDVYLWAWIFPSLQRLLSSWSPPLPSLSSSLPGVEKQAIDLRTALFFLPFGLSLPVLSFPCPCVSCGERTLKIRLENSRTRLRCQTGRFFPRLERCLILNNCTQA